MALYIELLEVGSDVVMSGSGTANITALSSPGGPVTQSPKFNTSVSYVIVGPAANVYEWFIGITGPESIGNGTNTPAYINDGDTFGIYGGGVSSAYLYLPVSYVSNTPLSAESTFTNKTFATLGATPGTYTWEWGSGLDADSLTIQIGPAEPTPTPTPTSTATPTPTPSSTPTPTPTSTSTPTPTPSSSPVTTTTTTEPMIVKSANTEYVECRICNDVAETQNTPHPVYTDNKGNEVIQMNAVVIGGNGLNS
jgi:cell division septation protein DedD